MHLEDGQEALDFIFGEGSFSNCKVEDTPKVILLDLKMPRVNGIQVLQKIRADERTKKDSGCNAHLFPGRSRYSKML